MSPILRELIEAINQSPEAFNLAIEKRKAELSDQIAEEARALYRKTSDLPTASVLAGIAGAIYRVLGNSHEELRCGYQMLEFQFGYTDTLEAYIELRSHYLALAGVAQGIGADDVRFQALHSAANCLYFAGETTHDLAVRNHLLLEALMLLTGLTPTASPSVSGSAHFEHFVSLLSSTADAVMNTHWQGLEAAKVAALLKVVTPYVEARIPADFQFSNIQFSNNLARAVTVARSLADLSAQYGSLALADQRRKAAMQMAEHDLEPWLWAAGDRYAKARRSAAAPEQLADVRRAIERQIDDRRKRFRSRAGRLWVSQRTDATLSGPIGDALQDGVDPREHLFEAVESLKARLLLDQIAGLESFRSPAIRSDLTEFERQVLRFAPDTKGGTARAELRLTSILSVGLRWVTEGRSEHIEKVEARYAQEEAGFRDIACVSPLKQIQGTLGPEEALVEYFIPTHRTHPAKELFALCITSTEFEIVPLSLEALPKTGIIGSLAADGHQPVDISPMGEAVWATRMAIHKGQEKRANQWLHLLWQVLIFPLLNRWHYPDEFKRWIIVPHGPLHYLPFAALASPGEKGLRLVEDVAISVCPSAAVLLALRSRSRPPVTSFLGIADPLVRDSGLPPLKDAKKELSNAMKSLAGLEMRPLPADLATETQVRQDIPGKGIVHFGAHGEFPESDPFDFHRILLTATKDHDGKLHAEELRMMDLSAARMVVLSICDGGLYRFGPGDEPLGLIPALFAAGAENVLAPLWKIEDAAARRLTSTFYRGLLKHGPAEALRRACTQAISKGTALRDWAGFVNVGSAAPLV